MKTRLLSIEEKAPRGSALVISLVFIIIITIAIVGFVTTASLERKTVQSHFAGVQSDLYNSMAVGVVSSRIAMVTSQSNTWWVSQPGQLSYSTYGNTPATTLVDLTSGTAASVLADVSVSLNPATLIEGKGLVTSDAAVNLPVKWVYVRKDGTQFTATTAPTYDPLASPIVGRYAFWTDDESARLNVNTAVAGSVALGESDPDLSTLPTGSGTLSVADIQKLKEVRTTKKRRFASVEELKAADGSADIGLAVTYNKDSLTHYSHGPGLNRFGEPRIALTTQENLAGGMPFLDILTTANSDPGVDSNLSKAKIEALFAKLYPYFGKRASEWGISYNGTNPTAATYGAYTIARKYSPTDGTKFSAQIILNLIDYVRSVESARPVILPIRAAFSGSTLTYGVSGYGATGNFGANAIRGNSRRIHVVEIGLWLPPTTVLESGKNLYKDAKLKTRVYLPATVGSSVDLAGLTLQPVLRSTTGAYLVNADLPISGTNVSEGITIGAGQYRTITHKIANLEVPTANARPEVFMRLALKDGGSGIGYDLVPVEQGETLPYYANYKVDLDSVAEADMTSISVDDPVINQCAFDWAPKKTGSQLVNKFGTQDPTPESTLGLAASAIAAQQDVDASGNLSGASVPPPAPKGTAGNSLGVVKSVGELGRVHSGGAGTRVAGTPWRTLRLQPRLAPQFNLPDWLLLDLFAAPLRESPDQTKSEVKADLAILRPQTDTVVVSGTTYNTAEGGRLNLNEKTYPFSAALTRRAPLKAILRGIKPSSTDAELNTMADNIISHTLATGLPLSAQGMAYGPTAFTTTGLYQMPGEVSEISGLATGEETEDLVRSLVGYLTTRSNVYSVFSVGQKVQQLANGQIKVLGEARTRTILERSNGKVKVVSTKELGL